MRYHSMAGATLAFVLSANAAFAAEADDTTCHKLFSQVSQQLNDNPQIGTRDQALRERNLGLQFCTHGYYKVGSDHFANALKLLGAESTQAQAG